MGVCSAGFMSRVLLRDTGELWCGRRLRYLLLHLLGRGRLESEQTTPFAAWGRISSYGYDLVPPSPQASEPQTSSRGPGVLLCENRASI